jgi:hypothetical protein
MTADWVGGPMLGRDHYLDIGSLIRDIHGELGRVAFRVLGHRADAEDAVQNGCVAVMRCWPKVARLETARQQRAYLVRTVTNEALKMLLRDKYRKHELLTVEGTEPGETEPGWLPEFPGGPGYAAREHLRYVYPRDAGLMRRPRSTHGRFHTYLGHPRSRSRGTSGGSREIPKSLVLVPKGPGQPEVE